MKKLVLTMAIATVAMFANASYIQWSVSSVMTPGTQTGMTAPFTSTYMAQGTGMAYLFIGTPDKATIASAIQAGTWSSASAVSSSAITGATGNISKSGSGVPALTFTSGSVSAYLVIFDATGDFFMISDAKTQSHVASNIAKSYAFGTVDVTSTWTAVSAVPEPTSMALLAIGGAVFGLRRKFRK